MLTDPKGCSVVMMACELVAKTEDSTVFTSVISPSREEAELEVKVVDMALVCVTYPAGFECIEDGTEVKPWVKLTAFDVNRRVECGSAVVDS